MKRALVLAVLWLGGTAFAADADGTATDCSRWSLQGVRIGMSVKELKGAQPKGEFHVGGKYLTPKTPASYSHYFTWPGDRMRGLWNMAFTDGRKDDDRVLGVAIALDPSTSAADVVTSLTERWGEPAHPRESVGKSQYFNGFGFLGEGERFITIWGDAACDTRVSFIDGTLISSTPGAISRPTSVREAVVMLQRASDWKQGADAKKEETSKALRP